MMYPARARRRQSWRKAESVLCSTDRKDALTKAEACREEIESKELGEATRSQSEYALGVRSSKRGQARRAYLHDSRGDYIRRLHGIHRAARVRGDPGIRRRPRAAAAALTSRRSALEQRQLLQARGSHSPQRHVGRRLLLGDRTAMRA